LTNSKLEIIFSEDKNMSENAKTLVI